MNTNNLLTYGKYDLTINKVFYRNMLIITTSIIVGMALLCFLGRWFVYEQMLDHVAYYESTGITPDSPFHPLNPANSSHYSQFGGTTFFLISLLTTLYTIFMGCTFHNLRTKMSRINELTLPVSNGKRYVWHILVTVVGGLLGAFVALLCADIINFLLHVFVFGTEHMISLTAGVCSSFYSGLISGSVSEFGSIPFSVRYAVVSGFVFQMCCYIYGNSVKYRHNIIITYAALQILSVIMLFLFFALALAVDGSMSTPDANASVGGFFYILGTIGYALSALLIWRSYKRYCNAQVVSRFNK